jgi:AbrB family looped-hinge helix DNA binding protein
MNVLVEVPRTTAYARPVKVRVSDKGRVTIPKQLRDQLGIRSGDELDLQVDGDRLVATNAAEHDAIDELYGSLKLPVSVDEWIDECRGPAERPLEGEL